MGTMAGPVTAAAGVAFVPGRSSFSVPDSAVIAHELGHNMSLYHAPCGGAGGPDPSYPDAERDGSEHGDGTSRRRSSFPRGRRTSCLTAVPSGSGDYHFTNAARFRLSDEDNDELPGPPPRSLLLWGGVNADGTPFLEPAFAVNAPATLPDSAGDYRLEGLRSDSTELFSLTFGMLEVADARRCLGVRLRTPGRTRMGRCAREYQVVRTRRIRCDRLGDPAADGDPARPDHRPGAGVPRPFAGGHLRFRDPLQPRNTRSRGVALTRRGRRQLQRGPDLRHVVRAAGR